MPRSPSKNTPTSVDASGIPVHCAFDRLVRVVDLKPHPDNPNRHPPEQVAAIGRAIRQLGWRNSITVSRLSDHVVRGHGRLLAAAVEGWGEVPVDFQDYASRTEEYADLVADNILSEQSYRDEDVQAAGFLELVTEAPDLVDAIGLSTDGLVGMFEHALIEESANLSPDASTMAEIVMPDKPRSQFGKVYTLGNHRIMCGDSKIVAHVAKLSQDDLYDLMFTDPPYNIDTRGGRRRLAVERGTLPFQNDNLSQDEFASVLDSCLRRPYGKPDSCAYVFFTWRWMGLVQAILEDLWKIANVIVWNKGSVGLGSTTHGYRYQHELLAYCEPKDAEAKPVWHGGSSYSDVWDFPREKIKMAGIATPKPVALVERAIMSSSGFGDVVCDPFGGGGSTLIACERTGRKCLMMEKVEANTDVTIYRWCMETNTPPDIVYSTES